MEEKTIKMNVYNAIAKAAKETLSEMCEIVITDDAPYIRINPKNDIPENILLSAIHEVFLPEKCCYNFAVIGYDDVVKLPYTRKLGEMNEYEILPNIIASVYDMHRKFSDVTIFINFSKSKPLVVVADKMIAE